MTPPKGATPLAALAAVAFDTETTGLDVREARIIELGAVAMPAGRPDPEASLGILVDPGMPVPAASSAVHGIGDAMLAGMPGFADAWNRFLAWCDQRPMIGYSVGFDLAVLENECRRHGVPWRKPRSLCVRTLASIANPDLPDHSLETLAAWLGVSISDRHRAVGDALAAGRIFAALVPHLRRRGIRTLAEAERASLADASDTEARLRAGWAEPAIRPEGAGGAKGKVDPYAYQHHVRDVMSAPPVTIHASADLQTAIALMAGRRISSVFVSPSGEPGGRAQDYRILTERDVMRRIASDGAAALSARAGDCASGPLVTIRGRQFVYRAMGRMTQKKIRHLAVVDDLGRLIGAVSARDLLKLRAGAAIALDDTISQAKSAADMAAAWATLPEVAGRLIGEEIEARTIAEIVSEELRAMTARAASLAEAALFEEGHGGPPCPYAVLVLGSGGRGESLLAPDQDNAIIFEQGEPDGPQDRWFAMLGERLSDMLDEAAIPLCRGGIMARNAAWRGNPALWRQRVGEWVRRASPKDLLNVDIVFDLVPVHGELGLGFDLFDQAFEIGNAHVPFAKLLSAQLENRETPFTLLGRIRTDDGRIDLKRHGLFPIVQGTRALAIRHDIRRRSTAGRLEGLIEKGIGGRSDIRSILDAHEIILSLMLGQQAADLQSGIPVSNKVETGALDARHLGRLKDALKLAGLIPEMVRSWMFDRPATSA